MQQVEVNSQQHGDISRDFSHSIGSGLIERVFHRKIQSKKVFAHKERIEAILIKSNELLDKVSVVLFLADLILILGTKMLPTDQRLDND